jgi:methionine-rich copper-binding protein CopC
LLGCYVASYNAKSPWPLALGILFLWVSLLRNTVNLLFYNQIKSFGLAMHSLRQPLLSKLSLIASVGFAALAFFAFSQQAQAADTLSTQTYIDTNGNGTVDHIKLTFDENIDLCTYEAGDWTVNTAGTINVAITGINTSNPEGNGQGDCNGTDAVVYLSITADANKTGGGTAPVISYANAGTAGSLSGVTTAQISAKASTTVSDAASPVVVSVSPTSGAGGVSVAANVVITFSESMDTGFAEATEFTISPDPGSFAAPSWASSNTVLTLNPDTNFTCGVGYTFTTVEAQIIASAGASTTLVTTGPQDGDWTFYVGSCNGGGGSTSVSAPVVSNITYIGAACDTDNAHSFTIDATNTAAYLVADNAYFAGASWVATSIESATNVKVALSEGATNVYVMLKSDTNATSGTYTLVLNDWAAACAQETTVPDESTNEDTTEEDSDTSEVTPVAGVSPGDVIVSSSSTAVYYVTENYTRRVFLNEQTFFTWYTSFDDVKTVSPDTLADLPLGPSMLPKAGTVLVKIQSDSKVYALEADGEATNLRLIPDETWAKTLFTANWADYVIDIEPTFFTKFGMGEDVTENFWVDMGALRKRVDLKAI